MEPSNAGKDSEQILASADQPGNTKRGQMEKDEETIPSKSPVDSNDAKMEEVIKELKIVRRQNQVTHCLMSVLIIVTAVWQLSEVSLFLSVKEMVTNPLKPIGDFVAGAFRGGRKKRAAESLTLPPVMVPELPRVDFPCMNLNLSTD